MHVLNEFLSIFSSGNVNSLNYPCPSDPAEQKGYSSCRKWCTLTNIGHLNCLISIYHVTV